MASYANPLRARIPDSFFRGLPDLPGVYLMFDAAGGLLYVGKAKNLKKRVRSYRNAAPGRTPEHITRMLALVARIKWQCCETESAALLRELELIQALRPHFNIAANWPASYLFIGIRREACGKAHLRLSAREREPGYRLYGCYKYRRRTKRGYSALVRLLYAAVSKKERFRFPAKLTRSTPAYDHACLLPKEWFESLRLFLSGRSRRLLHELTVALLENETLPVFMRPGLQQDLITARQFYASGPQATRRLRREYGRGRGFVGAKMMDELTARSIKLD